MVHGAWYMVRGAFALLFLVVGGLLCATTSRVAALVGAFALLFLVVGGLLRATTSRVAALVGAIMPPRAAPRHQLSAFQLPITFLTYSSSFKAARRGPGLAQGPCPPPASLKPQPRTTTQRRRTHDTRTHALAERVS
jgi:uncharacterized protein (DUF58 family)